MQNSGKGLATDYLKQGRKVLDFQSVNDSWFQATNIMPLNLQLGRDANNRLETNYESAVFIAGIRDKFLSR